MKILMLNNEYPPLGGGTGTVHKAILRKLAGVQALEIDVVTSAVDGKRVSESEGEGIRIHRIPMDPKNIHHASNTELLLYAVRAFRLSLALNKVRNYDLAMAWSALPAGVVALGLRRLIGLPYIVRVSGPDIPGFERRYQRLYPVLTPVIRSTWQLAETVVAKCRREADMIHEIDPLIQPDLIPNGVDVDQFSPVQRDHSTRPMRLLCVGRLIERKGQRHLIEVVADLVREGLDLSLDLVGTGDSLEAYRQTVAQNGLQSRVTFVGYVQRSEIPRWYQQAHVFVLPSYNEGMSVATLEAMASGLPIVATRTGGTDELVEEGENGFTFDWGDQLALRQSLKKLYHQPGMAGQMGQRSRLIAETYRWDDVAGTYLSLFSDLLPARALPIVHTVPVQSSSSHVRYLRSSDS